MAERRGSRHREQRKQARWRAWQACGQGWAGWKCIVHALKEHLAAAMRPLDVRMGRDLPP